MWIAGIFGLAGVILGWALTFTSDSLKHRWRLRDEAIADRRQVYARFLQAMSALTVQWVANREMRQSTPWLSALLLNEPQTEDLGPGVLRLSEQAAELELIAAKPVWMAARDWVRALQPAIAGEKTFSQEEALRLRKAFLAAAQADLGIPKKRRVREK